MTPIDRAALARSREPSWDDARSMRVHGGVLQARRRARRRSLAVDVIAAVVAGACLALLLVRVSARRAPNAAESGASMPPAVALADGAALGDGG